MDVFLISNMFPSQKDHLFGVFVKNFKIELEKQGVTFKKVALIKGKSTSKIKKAFNYLFHYYTIINYFIFSRYDLIYVHYLTHHIPVLTPLLFFKRKPLVINAHGSDIIGIQKLPILNYFGKIILKKSDLIVVPTSYFKENVISKYPFLNPDKLYVSPSGGVDKKKFFHKNSSLKNKELTLGFVSRFITEKGWQIFLDAIILLKKENIPFRALIAGKGPDEKKILNYVEKFDLTEKIDFIGFIEQNKLVDIYNQLDLYIFPSYRESESLGLTGLEAMACRTPVIACNIAGPMTYIENNINGFLIPPKSSEHLYKSIKKFYQLSDSEKEKIRQNAIESSTPYLAENVSKKLKAKLENLIS